MLTLWTVSVSSDWEELIWPIYRNQAYLLPLFLAFFVLVCLGILNVIIGIIVSHSQEFRQAQKNMLKQSGQMRTIRLVRELWSDNSTLRADGRGRMSLRSLEDSEQLGEIMDAMGLPSGFLPQDLFCILDLNGDGLLSQSEFVMGVDRLIAGTKFQQRCTLRLALGRAREHMDRLVYDGFDKLRNELACVQTVVETIVEGPPGARLRNVPRRAPRTPRGRLRGAPRNLRAWPTGAPQNLRARLSTRTPCSCD